jgi:hypothetical protein
MRVDTARTALSLEIRHAEPGEGHWLAAVRDADG